MRYYTWANAELEWLSLNVDPWQRVTEAWESTFGLRLSLFLTNKDFAIQEYFKQFKCLSMQDAKELLSVKLVLKENLVYAQDDARARNAAIITAIIGTPTHSDVEEPAPRPLTSGKVVAKLGKLQLQMKSILCCLVCVCAVENFHYLFRTN
ncbi:hypothetical protein TKK_0016709 [Trichogramma kaykai]